MAQQVESVMKLSLNFAAYAGGRRLASLHWHNRRASTDHCHFLDEIVVPEL